MTSTSETRGHLFVLHGLIQNFDYDAVIVPTDHRFDITSSWPESVTGAHDAARPQSWPRPFARSAAGKPVWFISVADEQLLSDEELIRRVAGTLSEIAGAELAKPDGRELTRIAIPVLGIGRGGLGDQRGAILRSLLATLLSFTANNHIDVLLVASNRAVFSAAQHARRELAREGSSVWDLNDDEMGEARRLGGLAADGHLALFLGAGVSIAAGLPTWDGLLEEVGADAGERPADFKELGALDKAEYLAVKMGADELNAKVRAAIGDPAKVAVAHALLAAMNCREAVTTNYDALYERAVEATGRHSPTILPWESVDPKREWLLKLHGDASRPETIVLTRRDFVLFDTKSKPAGSLLQALLLTKHLLIIGASLNDDNVIRLAMEVDEYLVRSGSRTARGTFVDVSGKPARQELWTQQFRWLICDGDSRSARARRMEILLDAVSAFSTADAPWVLDERFDGLLSDQDRAVTKNARALLAATESGSGLIAPLRSALSNLKGVRT
ncbi:SIR2 family protein [Gordonia sp. NPDC003585]|uniref:SIR2 family protein n=1 Tax=Gordonia sp. NPDC003585 TaxID=3154275 RepID=UPI0033B4EC51